MDDRLDPRLREQLEALKNIPARDPKAAANGRARFLQMAAEMKPENLPAEAVSSGLFGRLKSWIHPKPKTRKEGFTMANLFLAILLAVGVVFGGGGAAAYAAQDALPGDTLYPVKTAVESVEVALTTDPADRAALHMELAQERAAEIQALAAEGKTDMIPEVVANMQKHMQEGEALATNLALQGQQEAVARVMVMAQVAEQTLERAMKQAPPQAQPALAHALEQVKESQQRALQHLEEALTKAQQHAAQGEQEGKQAATQAQEQAEEAAANAQNQHQQMLGNLKLVDISGAVESMDGNTWTVNGQVIMVPKDAKVEGKVAVGDVVEIHGYINPQGQMVVVQVQPHPQYQGEGAVQSEGPNNHNGNENEGEGQGQGGQGESQGQEWHPTTPPTMSPGNWGGGMWGSQPTNTPENPKDGEGHENGNH